MWLDGTTLWHRFLRWELTHPTGGVKVHPREVVSRWTEVDGRRIHVRTSTHPVPPDAPTVVLVHGMVVSSRYMVPTLMRLAHFCRVFAPDLPGYGKSEAPPRHLETVPALADALARWLDAAGLERAVFLGNSLGCQTLADFAVRYPERLEGLILQGPTMDPSARTTWRQIKRWLANSPRERPAQMPLMLRDYWEAGLRGTLLTLRMALKDRIEDKLPHIQVPTLVVRGSNDPIVPQPWAEQVTRVLPRGRLAVIPGGTHTLNFAAPLELVRVIEPFLRGLRAGTERMLHAGAPLPPAPARLPIMRPRRGPCSCLEHDRTWARAPRGLLRLHRRPHLGRGRTSSMKNERLSWALGWMSLGIGLTELTIPERICRVLGAPGRSGLVRTLGLREVASGLGLLLQPHRRQWSWSRVAGDALDLALLAVTFRRPRANRAWQGAFTAAVAGATLVDLYAAVTKRSAPRLRSATVAPSLGMDAGSSGPTESWRGSGLAEDVGVSRPRGGEEGESEEKQRMMKEAERELGLPSPDEHGTPH